MAKRITGRGRNNKKAVCAPATQESSNNKYLVWRFDKADQNGLFRFDLEREDMDHKLLLQKIMVYSNRTWGEIIRETHDQKNKTCHHPLDVAKVSTQALERIRAMELEGRTDGLFSLRLGNLKRIVGIRENEVFHAIWYDPKHEFYPSSR